MTRIAPDGRIAAQWEFISDRVMGGVSEGQLSLGREDGMDVAVLTGEVSLENNGGFIQMASDLADDGAAVDLSGWSGVRFDARGNGATYELRLRTAQLTRPWQSFRAEFATTKDWRRINLPFDTFRPHRTDAVFDPSCLRRIGVLGIGRAGAVHVALRDFQLV